MMQNNPFTQSLLANPLHERKESPSFVFRINSWEEEEEERKKARIDWFIGSIDMWAQSTN